jgi:hypothetical protein
MIEDIQGVLPVIILFYRFGPEYGNLETAPYDDEKGEFYFNDAIFKAEDTEDYVMIHGLGENAGITGVMFSDCEMIRTYIEKIRVVTE